MTPDQHDDEASRLLDAAEAEISFNPGNADQLIRIAEVHARLATRDRQPSRQGDPA